MLIRGLVAIALGVATFIWPNITFAALVLLFGVFVFTDGVMAIAGAFGRGPMTESPWWALLLVGLAGVAAGIITFAWPGITGLVLVYVIAAWALVAGVFEIVTAIRLRRYIEGEMLLVLIGVISIILAITFFASPGVGALTIALWIGIYALILGVLEVALAFRLRKWQQARLAPA